MPKIIQTPERQLRERLSDLLLECGLLPKSRVLGADELVNVLRQNIRHNYDPRSFEPGPDTLTGDQIPF